MYEKLIWVLFHSLNKWKLKNYRFLGKTVVVHFTRAIIILNFVGFSPPLSLIFAISCFITPGLKSENKSALISSDSEKFQSWFSAVHYLNISGQPWLTSESALIFSETELITAEALLNSSKQYQIFFETALNIPEFCVFPLPSSPNILLFFSRETQIIRSLEI